MGAIAHPISAAVSDDMVAKDGLAGVKERIHNSMDHVFVAATLSTKFVARITICVSRIDWVKPAIFSWSSGRDAKAAIKARHVGRKCVIEKFDPSQLAFVGQITRHA